MKNPYLVVKPRIKVLEKSISDLLSEQSDEVSEIARKYSAKIAKLKRDIKFVKSGSECTHYDDKGKYQAEYSQDPGSGRSEHYCNICGENW